MIIDYHNDNTIVHVPFTGFGAKEVDTKSDTLFIDFAMPLMGL